MKMQLNLSFSCLLLLTSWTLNAQVETLLRGPAVPDPVPPREQRVVAPLPTSTVAVSPPDSNVVPPSPVPLIPLQGQGVLPNPISKSDEVPPFDRLLSYWFGQLPGPDFFPEDKLTLWFGQDPENNRQILNDFGQYLIDVGHGKYNNWRESPRGRLALIVLLDQIPRRIYRNQPREFMFDRMAEVLAIEGIQKGDDKRLYPVERVFFYLPLIHSEDLQMQNLGVLSYRTLFAESSEELKGFIGDFLKSAMARQQIITRFGRFPERNAILGRASSPEETVFLMQARKPVQHN